MSATPARHWNTWDGTRPAAMVHLPTGLTVRLTAYSAKTNTYDPLLAGEAIELHEHTAEGDYVRLRAHVADSVVDIEFAKEPGSGALVGRASLQEAGEWALRFWLCLEIGHTDVRHGPPTVRERPTTVSIEPPGDPYTGAPVVTARHRSTWHCLVTDSAPVFHGCYADIADLRSELEGSGYYAPHAEVESPSWAVLRFNGQANADVRFALGFGNDRSSALSRAHTSLVDSAATLQDRRDAAGKGTEPWKAIRDVVAWNTVWDVPNARPITVLTRNWLSGKFGGWGVWLDDVLFNALLAGYAGDWETAYANLDAALSTVGGDGNLPCLRTAYEEWVDRSQPPIAGYVLWRIFALTGDRSLLTRFLPVIVRAHDWWFEARDGNGDGLLEFGSSPTGTGAFVHSKQAALDEAAMDNLPMFDDARFDPQTHTLDLAEPALNSLLSLEAEALADMLTVLGEHDDARRIAARGEGLAELIRTELWDDDRGVFAGKRWDGSFASSLAPTSFYPWLCGGADAGQTERMLQVLLDEQQFWGPRVLPASTFDDPASADLVYWRGRIWPPHAFWVWEGLRRTGRPEVAAAVADRSWRMFEEGWRRRRCHENFHPRDAAGDASPDSDPFYSWGALLPLTLVMTEAESSPWDGRVLDPSGGTQAILREPGRTWVARSLDDGLEVSVNGRKILAVGSVSRIRLDTAPGRLRLAIDPQPDPVAVRLTGVTSSQLVRARCDGSDVGGADSPEGWSVVLAPGATTTEILMTGDPWGQPC